MVLKKTNMVLVQNVYCANDSLMNQENQLCYTLNKNHFLLPFLSNLVLFVINNSAWSLLQSWMVKIPTNRVKIIRSSNSPPAVIVKRCKRYTYIFKVVHKIHFHRDREKKSKNQWYVMLGDGWALERRCCCLGCCCCHWWWWLCCCCAAVQVPERKKTVWKNSVWNLKSAGSHIWFVVCVFNQNFCIFINIHCLWLFSWTRRSNCVLKSETNPTVHHFLYIKGKGHPFLYLIICI